jgi:GGDEF domain-containing protein
LHNRTYLFDRLSLECERARRNGELFSVIVMQIRGGESHGKPDRNATQLSSASLRKIAELIDSMTHPGDMVSLLSSHELVVLANRVDRESRHTLQDRLREALSDKLPEILGTDAPVDVKTGAATYGTDGQEPSVLVQAARTSAALGVHNRSKAA